MASNERLAMLAREYEGGRNAHVFIPYASALRRDRQYGKALEVCQRGLIRNPDSVAGRTLLGRLLCDLGRYQESLEILSELFELQPQASGVGVALARTLVRMREMGRAEQLLKTLSRENPLEAEIAMLEMEVRQQQREAPAAAAPASPATPSEREKPPQSVSEILSGIIGKLQSTATVRGGVIASLNKSFETQTISDARAPLALLESLREINQAYFELEFGIPINGQMDLEGGTLLFACRDDDIVILAVEPSAKMGRMKALFEHHANRMLPINHRADTLHAEENE